MPKWVHVLALLLVPLVWGLVVEYVFHRIRGRRRGNDPVEDGRP